jgi:hypothetical protein
VSPGVATTRSIDFERCWHNAGALAAFEFGRLVEADDEVFVDDEQLASLQACEFVIQRVAAVRLRGR